MIARRSLTVTLLLVTFVSLSPLFSRIAHAGEFSRIVYEGDTESDRDRAAKIINGPKFREWASSNGFTIGSVQQPDPKSRYAAEELTTTGLYIPGRDDYDAVMLFQRQLSMDPTKPHPFMLKGSGIRGRTREYGYLDVQRGAPGEIRLTAGEAMPSERVYGAFSPQFAGDPIGSQRLNRELYLKDEATGKFYRAEGQAEPTVSGKTVTSAPRR